MKTIIAATTLLLMSVLTSAQVATGRQPFASYGGGPFDSVNLGNLNVNFTVPITQKAGRGVPFFYNLAYNNSVWFPVNSSGVTTWQPLQNWGWQTQTDAQFGYVARSTITSRCRVFDPDTGLSGWSFYNTYAFGGYNDRLGAVHSMGGYTTPGSTACGVDPVASFTAAATDGSGYTLTVTNYTHATVTTASGTVLTPGTQNNASGSLTDPNGNIPTASVSGTTTTFTDTLGATALTISGNPPTSYSFTNSSGGTSSVTAGYSTYTIQTNFGCSGIGEFSQTNVQLLTSLTLPDNTQYLFAYEATPGNPSNVTGRIASVTLPTGGTITYTYSGGSNGINCSDGSTAGLTRTLSGNIDNSGAWTYTRTFDGTRWTTTITDPVTPTGNQTTVLFANNTFDKNFYEVNRTVYSGNVSSNNKLFSIDTCYNNSCNQNVSAQITSTNVWSHPGAGSDASMVGTIYNSFGLPTGINQYDFGSVLVRSTSITYANPGNGIVDRPSNITVTDPSNNTVSQTLINYDETALTSTSGAPQHDYTNYGASFTQRGNPTTIKQWVSGTAFITSTNAYDDLGNLRTTTDQGGHTTTFDYTDNYNDNTNHNTQAFATKITSPTTNSGGIGTTNHIVKNKFYWPSAMLYQSIDQNNQATTYTYDNMWRPIETDLPDGGKTLIKYPPVSNPHEIWTWSYLDSTNHTDFRQHFDGFGRIDRTANNSTTGTWEMADTCFNASGQISFAAYTYSGATGWSQAKVCSGAGDSFYYDALGRNTSVTHSDSNTVLTSYSAKAVKVQDEGNGSGTRVTHVYQQDGLGRTTSVCEEANSIFGTTVNPCGLDLDGSMNGVITSYTYDPLDRIKTISQGSLITRQFGYDGVSHLLGEIIPEVNNSTACTGSDGSSYSVCFFYDSEGKLITRTRLRPNQAVGGTAVTNTTYRYDELHRPWTVDYDDTSTENTPAQAFFYDSGTNNIGRLTYTATENHAFSVGYTSDSLGYDVMGRVTGDGQAVWVPSYVSRNFSYTYNLVGEPLTQNFSNYTLTNTYNAAGRLMQVTSSLNDAQHPGTLLSNLQYNQYGEVTGDSLGNGVNETFGFDTRGRLQSISALKNTTTIYRLGGPGVGNVITYAPDSNLSATGDSVNGSWTYSYDSLDRIATARKGTTIDVRFTNDSCSACGGSPVGGGDRNLYINSITVGSTTIAANDSSVSYVGAPCNGYQNNVGTLLCNGDLISTSTASGQSVTVAAYGSPDYNIYPHMQVYVDGVLAGEWDVTGTSQNYTATIPSQMSGYPNQSASSLSFDIDRNGNRWHQTPGTQIGFDQTTNHIAAGNGVTYDAVGNIINDGTHSYTYDAEYRITTVDGGLTATYLYDAFGRRVQRVVGSNTYNQFYDLGGNMVNEQVINNSWPNGAWNRGEIFAGERHLGTYNLGSTFFSHVDWLGSERVRSDVNGNNVGSCTGNPYGDSFTCAGTDPSPFKYAGMEFDYETGLSHTLFRYYNPRLGLWMTRDPAGLRASDLRNPQSLNLVTYSIGDPVNFFDPLGLQSQFKPYVPSLDSWETGWTSLRLLEIPTVVGYAWQFGPIDDPIDESGAFPSGNSYKITYDGWYYGPVYANGTELYILSLQNLAPPNVPEYLGGLRPDPPCTGHNHCFVNEPPKPCVDIPCVTGPRPPVFTLDMSKDEIVRTCVGTQGAASVAVPLETPPTGDPRVDRAPEPGRPQGDPLGGIVSMVGDIGDCIQTLDSVRRR